jgi:hypothetical protein
MSKTSLDLNIPKLEEIAKNYNIFCGDGIDIYLPIALLTKDPELYLDVSDGHGNVLSAVNSDITSALTCNYFTVFLMLQKKILQIPSRVQKGIKYIIDSVDGIEYYKRIVAITQPGRRELEVGDDKYSYTAEELKFFRKLLDDEDITILLNKLARHRHLVVNFRVAAANNILKYQRLLSYPHRYVKINHSIQEAKDTKFELFLVQLSTFFGIRALSYVFLHDGAGTSGREHIRVISPSGARIVSGAILRQKDADWEIIDKTTDPVNVRNSENVVTCYTKGVRKANYGVHIQIIPRIGTFYFPALVCSLLMFFFSATSFPNPLNSWFFGESTAEWGESSIALLASVPIFLATFLVRDGEHGLIARMHIGSRIILLVPAILMLCGAWAASAKVQESIQIKLSWVILISSLAASIIFISVIFRSLKRYGRKDHFN